MKALELIGLAKSVVREDALSTMPIVGKVFKIKTDEIIKVVKQDHAYITYVVKSGGGFGSEEVQVSLNDFEGLLPTEYAVESLELGDVDSFAGECEDIISRAKKFIPNIRATSAAQSALKAMEQAMDKFIAIAAAQVEESKKKNESNKNYDALVDALDVIPTSKAPKGLEAVVDLFAQVYNGGIAQYVQNDYFSDLSKAVSFLQSVGGSVCKDIIANIKKHDRYIADYNAMAGQDDDEGRAEDLEDKLEPFDDYMYANDRIDKACGEIVAWLKKQKIIAEALSKSDAKIQAQQLVQYLLKFNDPDAQAEAGSKWFDSKDFSPEDKALIFQEYDKITPGKKLVDSSEIDMFGEAKIQESGKVTSFEVIDLGIHAETPADVDQKDYQNIVVASGTSARDAGEEAIDVISGKDVVVSTELESAVGELAIEDDAGEGFHYVAILFNTEVAEAMDVAIDWPFPDFTMRNNSSDVKKEAEEMIKNILGSDHSKVKITSARIVRAIPGGGIMAKISLSGPDNLISKIKGEISEAAKRLASSGEKAKFQNLKKQIDALEQEKLKIRDQLAALVGKDEPQKSDALRDRRTAILDKIKKLEDEKRKMHNQFRGLMAKS